jgi:hypothetical protein
LTLLTATLFVGVVGLLSSCQVGGASLPPIAPASENTVSTPFVAMDPSSVTADGDQARLNDSTTNTSNRAQTRLVIKDAELQLVVDDPRQSSESITVWVDQNGGWVVEANITGRGSNTQASFLVRVPSERLNDALAFIRNGAKEILFEKTTGSDVTNSYVDTSSQIKNMEAAEAQLQAIMDKAPDTEAVIAVYRELVSMRGQIEQLKGRLQYYDEAVAYSSVRVSLRTSSSPRPTPSWGIEGVLASALLALRSILQFVVSILVWAIVVGLPLLIIVGLPLFIIFHLTRRLAVRQRASTPLTNIDPPATS